MKSYWQLLLVLFAHSKRRENDSSLLDFHISLIDNRDRPISLENSAHNRRSIEIQCEMMERIFVVE